MKVISLINNKGGVGKTTLAINIAQCLNLCPTYKNKVVLVDTDKNGNLQAWQNAQGNKRQLEVTGAINRSSLLSAHKLAKSYGAEYFIIDTSGSIAEIHGASLALSHLVIIPLNCSGLDYWATEAAYNLVFSAKVNHPDLKTLFVINQAPHSSNFIEGIKIALHDYEDIPQATSIVHDRVVFKKSATRGDTIYDWRGKLAINAKNEINTLTHEILCHLAR